MAFPSPTKNYHTTSYPDIDPTSARLSTKGKNVVITGGGSGIGGDTTLAFAKSGASNIALLGRTEKTLLETKKRLATQYSGTAISTYAADLVDKQSLERALATIHSSFGTIDVLVANAGYLPTLQSIADTDLDEWYNGFEVNVKGNFNLIRAFLPHAAEDAAVINISTGIVHLPFLKGYSGYHTSKLASAKMFDYLHKEHPNLFVLNVHPGVIVTAMNDKTKDSGTVLPFDDGMFSHLQVDLSVQKLTLYSGPSRFLRCMGRQP